MNRTRFDVVFFAMALLVPTAVSAAPECDPEFVEAYGQCLYPPVGMAFQQISPTSIKIGWLPYPGSQQQYPAPDKLQLKRDQVEIKTFPGNHQNGFLDQGLTPGKVYLYELCATYTLANRSYCASIKASTPQAPALPDNPSVTIVPLNYNELRVDFTVGKNTNQAELSVTPPRYGKQLWAVAPDTLNSWFLQGLNPASTYTVDICAIGQNGRSCTTSSATTPPPPVAPLPGPDSPRNFDATLAEPGSVSLMWSNPKPTLVPVHESSRIQRRRYTLTDQGSLLPYEDWQTLQTVSPDVAGYMDTSAVSLPAGLFPVTQFHYRVCAVGNGLAACSEDVTAHPPLPKKYTRRIKTP